jgi:hypothetical protein
MFKVTWKTFEQNNQPKYETIDAKNQCRNLKVFDRIKVRERERKKKEKKEFPLKV